MPPEHIRKICPLCRKGPIGLWMGAVVGILYKCNNCGYQGPVVLEPGKAGEQRRFKEHYKRL